MAKKKATMTLKDFHGGSIPSDLRLPSAPGVTVRPSDRAAFDRPTAWGNAIGRSEPRLRPGSAGSVRTFDDKTPFFGNNAHIGRNFDEDERKPLDGISGPRRTISDDSVRAVPVRVDQKTSYSSMERPPSRPGTSPVTSMSSGSGNNSFASRFSEASNGDLDSQSVTGKSVNVGVDGSHARFNQKKSSGNDGQTISGSNPNAWGLRKEEVCVPESVSPWSLPDAASKLVHASALEKVSSGRWHSKQPINHHVRQPERESELYSRGYNTYNRDIDNTMDVIGGIESHGIALARHAEISLKVDDGLQGGSKGLTAYDRAKSPMYSRKNETNPSIYADGLQSINNADKFSGTDLPSHLPSEAPERPKLKLLPRSKQLETLEAPVDQKLGLHRPVDHVQLENRVRSLGEEDPIKSGLAGPESGNQIVERPKLNLKPRSQPIEQLEVNAEKERNQLFGGARPRELVLKERGVDDLSNHDLGQPAIRVRQDVQKTETGPIHSTPTRQNERADFQLDHRVGKNTAKQDLRMDGDRTEAQRRIWRSDSGQTSSRDIEKHLQNQNQQQQQARERPPSPETWRKPVVEQTHPVSHDAAAGPRHGKAASAVELAQEFSRSVSDPKAPEQFSTQRGIPSRGQLPFSRLTGGPTPRPQVNGY